MILEVETVAIHRGVTLIERAMVAGRAVVTPHPGILLGRPRPLEILFRVTTIDGIETMSIVVGVVAVGGVDLLTAAHYRAPKS